MYYWFLSAMMLGMIFNSECCRQGANVVQLQCRKIANLCKIQKRMNIMLTYKLAKIACAILWSTMWMMISQWLNNTVLQIGKNRYMIHFSIGGKRYSTIVKHTGGPSPVLQVIDGDNDITEAVEPYLLFKAEDVTLGDLGYTEVVVLNQDGTDHQYSKNGSEVKPEKNAGYNKEQSPYHRPP